MYYFLVHEFWSICEIMLWKILCNYNVLLKCGDDFIIIKIIYTHNKKNSSHMCMTQQFPSPSTLLQEQLLLQKFCRYEISYAHVSHLKLLGQPFRKDLLRWSRELHLSNQPFKEVRIPWKILLKWRFQSAGKGWDLRLSLLKGSHTLQVQDHTWSIKALETSTLPGKLLRFIENTFSETVKHTEFKNESHIEKFPETDKHPF